MDKVETGAFNFLVYYNNNQLYIFTFFQLFPVILTYIYLTLYYLTDVLGKLPQSVTLFVPMDMKRQLTFWNVIKMEAGIIQ